MENRTIYTDSKTGEMQNILMCPETMIEIRTFFKLSDLKRVWE